MHAPLPSQRGLKRQFESRLTVYPGWTEFFPKNQMSHNGLIQRSSVFLLFTIPGYSTSGWVIYSYLSLMTTYYKKLFIDYFAIYFSLCNFFWSYDALCFHGSIIGIARSEAVLGRTNMSWWIMIHNDYSNHLILSSHPTSYLPCLPLPFFPSLPFSNIYKTFITARH